MTHPKRIFTPFLGLTLCLGATAALAAAPFAPSAARGQAVYQKACAACHGETGNGKGQGAAPLNPKPRDFTTGIYKFRTTSLGELPTDSDLLKVVTNGIPHTQMPPFKNVLTGQERLDVVAYIKKFSADFEEAEEAPEVIDLPEPPASTAEFVAEGKNLYMALDCWSCHGPKGKGDGSAAKGLRDGWGNPIRPMNLTSTQYKGGADAKNIYRTIHTGLNGTPMSAFGGAFGFGGDKVLNTEALATAYSKGEIEALQAYMATQPTAATLASGPAGAKEDLVLQRKWALVHYVRSLQKQSLVNWLFVEDTEVTK
jgi:mono/diheme cytochrome c family protein